MSIAKNLTEQTTIRHKNDHEENDALDYISWQMGRNIADMIDQDILYNIISENNGIFK